MNEYSEYSYYDDLVLIFLTLYAFIWLNQQTNKR